MKDLSKMSGSELQQMLTNIYTIATSYTGDSPEKCTRIEKITILFEKDSVELATLLEYNPDEYFRLKYSKEPVHTEAEAMALIIACKDLQELELVKSTVIKDRKAYPPKTYERIIKVIYFCQHQISDNPSIKNRAPSIAEFINEKGQDCNSFFQFNHMAHLIITADGLQTLEVLKSNIEQWSSVYELDQAAILLAMVSEEMEPYKLLLN